MTTGRAGRRRSVALLVVLLVVAGCGAPAGTRHMAHPFYGLDEPFASVAREQQLTAHLGVRPTVFSMFIRLDTTTTVVKLAALRAAALVPFVTLEPWHLGDLSGAADPDDSLRRLLSGAFDAELLTQARMLATYPGPFYLRFAHEMNAPWYPWGTATNGNTAREYVRAWRHVHTLFDAVAGLHARWVWSPVIAQNPGASSSWASFYPGDDVVDYVGLTGYEHRSPDPATTFDPDIARLRALSRRPVLLSEVGSDGPAKSRWLAALGTYLMRRPAIAGFVYFDTDPQTTGATGDYALTSLAERSAFRLALGTLTPSEGTPR